MIGTEQKVKEILDEMKEYSKEMLESYKYTISRDDLKSICEEFLASKEWNDSNMRYIERQNNYIRLLEKENKELRGEKIC